MRDLLKSAIHVVAMDAFANDSTIAFLKQYQDNDIRIFDNKYQPCIGETVKILYNPDKGSEAIRRGLKMLREGKHVVFAMTSCKKARALANQAFALQKLDGLPMLTRVYFGQKDGMQRQEDFTNIKTGVHIEAFVQMLYQIRDYPQCIISLYNSQKSSEIF